MDMQHLDKILSNAKCQALGLNEHFPRAVLHGPTSLGGIGVQTAISKTTTSRINYFFYHTRLTTKVGEKLATSIAYLQIESGLFQHFFSSPFHIYGHYMTTSLAKCLWEETEPKGLTLRPAEGEAWTPQQQGPLDFPLMELITKHYNKKETGMLNRYHLYLQVVSFYDLVTYDGTIVHPSIA